MWGAYFWSVVVAIKRGTACILHFLLVSMVKGGYYFDRSCWFLFSIPQEDVSYNLQCIFHWWQHKQIGLENITLSMILVEEKVWLNFTHIQNESWLQNCIAPKLHGVSPTIGIIRKYMASSNLNRNFGGSELNLILTFYLTQSFVVLKNHEPTNARHRNLLPFYFIQHISQSLYR